MLGEEQKSKLRAEILGPSPTFYSSFRAGPYGLARFESSTAVYPFICEDQIIWKKEDTCEYFVRNSIVRVCKNYFIKDTLE